MITIKLINKTNHLQHKQNNKIKPINFQNITKKFGSLDLDNNGEISVQELWIVMKGLGLVDTKKDIERLIKRLSSQ